MIDLINYIRTSGSQYIQQEEHARRKGADKNDTNLLFARHCIPDTHRSIPAASYDFRAIWAE